MTEGEEPCQPLTLLVPLCSETDMQIETRKRTSAAVPVTSDKCWPRLKAPFSSSTVTGGLVVSVRLLSLLVGAVSYRCGSSDTEWMEAIEN